MPMGNNNIVNRTQHPYGNQAGAGLRIRNNVYSISGEIIGARACESRITTKRSKMSPEIWTTIEEKKAPHA